jgi:GWxTD domain-containing protein
MPLAPRAPKQLAQALVCALLFLPLLSGRPTLLGQQKLLPEHARFLEDVAPIMTRAEKDVFNKLRTPAEREKFIRFFWRARDPKPDTAENEFQKEYMERVRFADENFGRSSFKRGSQTDRGLFYLILGPPLERQVFAAMSQIRPMELWFYKGDTAAGLPDYFYLIFFQPEGQGDYRLYYPGVDTPAKLVVPQMYGGTMNVSSALDVIKKVNSELGQAAQSYLPGETPFGTVSMTSDIIIAAVRQLPEKKFSDAYARSYLAYKDYVETDYVDNYLNSACLVRVFRTRGQAFLHWTIEPERMDFAADGNQIYAGFELVLRLEDGQGRAVFERTEDVPVRLTPEQYKANERRRFAFQDLLPVIPGEFRALFLLKNKTAREFSSFETRVKVLGEGQASLSQPLLFLYREEKKTEPAGGGLKAFMLDGIQHAVGARNEFPQGGELGVYVQAWGLDSAAAAENIEFEAEIFSVDTSQPVGKFDLAEVRTEGPGRGGLSASGVIPLAGFQPGYYRVEVGAVVKGGPAVPSVKENFIILAARVPVAPWALSRVRGDYPGPEHLKILGGQYFLTGEYEKARSLMEKVAEAGNDPAASLLLAKSYFGLGRYREALKEAAPLYEKTGDRETGKLLALCQAGLKDWAAALPYLEKLMSEATEVPVLNLAAECHLNLGRPEKALPLVAKSLELAPGQAEAKELEQRVRKALEGKKQDR